LTLYNEAFENTVIWHEGKSEKIFNEEILRRVEKQIDWEIENKLLPEMNKESRRYFREKYVRAVCAVFRPIIEA